MIQFACPGCSATYTVGDEKGGKAGRCPKCQTQFTIPMPSSSAPVSAPTPSAPPLPSMSPPPPPTTEAVEIAPCPGCQARLSVTLSDLGTEVACPYCQTAFKARRPGTDPGPSAPAPAPRGRSSGGLFDDDDVVPKGRSLRDEDDARPTRRRPVRDDYDDEEDEAPRDRRRRSRANLEPHRGGMILTFGILSLICCPIIFGLIAITSASTDLGKMANGTMDDSGSTLTHIGRILGIIGLILGVVGIFIRVAAR